MTSAGKWPLRLMVYGAGEAINGASELDTQIEAQLAGLGRVATNRYVAALAQLDSSNVPPVRYVLDPLNRQPRTQIPDFNAGDPQELVNFAQWSSEICPAERSVLVLSGHGSAWEDDLARQVLGTRGIAPPAGVDLSTAGKLHHPRTLFGPKVTPQAAVARAVLIDGSDRDYLSNAELGAVCERIAAILGGPIDVLVFDACLMSSWEILQEISSSVSTVVASVDELSAAGVDLSNPTTVMTANQGQMTAQELAGTIAGQFQPRASFDSCVAIDLSVPQWPAGINSFRSFCGALMPWLQASPANATSMRDALRLAATSIVQFWSGGLADVSALANAVARIPGVPPPCLQALQDTESALRACVIRKTLGGDYANALGISIFAPNSIANYKTNRPDYVRLQFSNATGWGDVLDALYADSSGATRFVSPQGPKPNADQGTEFRAVLRGLKLDQATKDRTEQAVRHAVFEQLASIDLKGDLDVTPLKQFTATRKAKSSAKTIGDFPGTTAGLVVRSGGLVFENPLASTPTRLAEPSSTDDIDFRVFFQGLDLSQPDKQRIEGAIQKAVMQEVAVVDLQGDLAVTPGTALVATRGLGSRWGGIVLGLILKVKEAF